MNISLMGSPLLPIMQTPRLRLQFPQLQDGPAWGVILNNLKTMQYLRFMTMSGYSWDEARISARIMRHQQLTLAGETCLYDLFVGDTLIGNAGFQDWTPDKKEASFGIIVHHPWWRQGLATEVFLYLLEYGFSQLKLEHVYFKTAIDNTRMQKFFDRFAIPFSYISKHDVINRDGQAEDYRVYSLLRQQWPRTKQLLEEALYQNAMNQKFA